jgi:hypothetical protein
MLEERAFAPATTIYEISDAHRTRIDLKTVRSAAAAARTGLEARVGNSSALKSACFPAPSHTP